MPPRDDVEPVDLAEVLGQRRCCLRLVSGRGTFEVRPPGELSMASRARVSRLMRSRQRLIRDLGLPEAGAGEPWLEQTPAIGDDEAEAAEVKLEDLTRQMCSVIVDGVEPVDMGSADQEAAIMGFFGALQRLDAGLPTVAGKVRERSTPESLPVASPPGSADLPSAG